MQQLEIVAVTARDIAQLQQIGKQTFYETFAASNTAANMQQYLNDSFASDRLTAELQDPNAAFYFAKVDDNVVGYLKINFGHSQTELKDNNAVEIERIYVVKELHGQRVGQLLYNKAIEIAQARKASYIWLGVWEENLRAINFYKKNGFVEFDKHVFRLGNDEQTDIMMKRDL